MFFFFKQKTAYELRISDWSSDVCSSDLRGIQGQHLAHDQAAHDGNAQRLAQLETFTYTQRQRQCAQQRGRRRHHDGAEDRKSVVWGKSVSVRVGLGGRRIIKKKKQSHSKTKWCSLRCHIYRKKAT